MLEHLASLFIASLMDIVDIIRLLLILKIIFTCPLGTYAYRRMPFGLYNAPTTF
jgi:hypothetical protein